MRVSTREPRGDRRTQRARSDRHGIIRQSLEASNERIGDERGRRMPRLSDRQIDFASAGLGSDVGATIAAAARTDRAAAAKGGDSR